DRYSAEVRALIDGLGVGDRVQVRGMLEGTALAACYERADAFVLPSRSEGFGTVYAEAFNFGLPVIGYRVPSLSWLEGPAGPGAALLVSPGDVTALGEAMASLVADAALRDRMAAAASLKAAKLPTWHESERSFTEVVRAALDTASGA
ncbi:MAG TPA: glycosyltransferase, partial [Chloroflexota bacterium]